CAKISDNVKCLCRCIRPDADVAASSPESIRNRGISQNLKVTRERTGSSEESSAPIPLRNRAGSGGSGDGWTNLHAFCAAVSDDTVEIGDVGGCRDAVGRGRCVAQ